jgi:hypothetical protein
MVRRYLQYSINHNLQQKREVVSRAGNSHPGNPIDGGDSTPFSNAELKRLFYHYRKRVRGVGKMFTRRAVRLLDCLPVLRLDFESWGMRILPFAWS